MADVFEGLDARFWTLAGREESQVPSGDLRVLPLSGAVCGPGGPFEGAVTGVIAGITARTGNGPSRPCLMLGCAPSRCDAARKPTNPMIVAVQASVSGARQGGVEAVGQGGHEDGDRPQLAEADI